MSTELTPLPSRHSRPNTSSSEAPDTSSWEERSNRIQALPPPDRGAAAWKFLFGASVIEGFMWGLPLSFGVFQEYYSKQDEFRGDGIAIVGTLSTSIYFLGAPFATPLVRRFQRFQRHMIVLGCALCILSLVAASFVSNVAGLIATQGILYGFGFLTLYFPVLSMLNEWFVQRRGLAYGMMYAGGGLSGVAYPFILDILLSRYGHKTTLRGIAIAQFLCVAPILPLVKGRLPSSSQGSLRMFDASFLRQPLFYCFALSNLFQGLAYYIPALYLPSFASALGLSGAIGALLLAANNLATIIGQVSFGWLSDRTNNIFMLIFISSFVSAVATFTIWGFADSLGALLAFSLIYGWFAGAFVIFWPKFGSILSDDPRPVFSMMAFGKGIGNIAIGPISAQLIKGIATPSYGLGKFEPLILYTGSLMLCSSMGIIGWSFRGHRE